jgi:hypothetical protein
VQQVGRSNSSRRADNGIDRYGISRFSGCGMTSASVAAIKRHLN